MKNFFGWKHVLGPYTVLEIFPTTDVERMREYGYIKKFVEPFEAENIEEALNYIKLITE